MKTFYITRIPLPLFDEEIRTRFTSSESRASTHDWFIVIYVYKLLLPNYLLTEARLLLSSDIWPKT